MAEDKKSSAKDEVVKNRAEGIITWIREQVEEEDGHVRPSINSLKVFVGELNDRIKFLEEFSKTP